MTSVLRPATSLLKKLLCLSILTAACHGAAAQVNPPEGEYERWYAPQGKPYTKDPYVWAYSREFASRYGMPAEWVDENLKGAMAVAFRMTTIGYAMCGLGGRAENCWPPLECQMDIYYDRNIKLPWRREEVLRDVLMTGISSRDFIYDVHQNKGIKRYKPQDGSVLPRVLESGGVITVGKFQSMEARVAYFDREFDDRIGLLGWIGGGVCPQGNGAAGRMVFNDPQTRIADRSRAEADPAHVMHVIEFPESFMRRVRVAYERDNKANRETTERLRREFETSREASKKSVK